MLNNLRNETRQNRDLCNDVLGRELNDKKERYQRIEMLLQEPVTTQNELERLTAEVSRLRREVGQLEQKIEMNTPADDKLSIYKTQANSISKKKLEKEEECKKLEAEKLGQEKLLRGKEEKYAQEKGGKYMKRDDFRQYAANLRVKNANFKVTKKVLDEIKAEVVVLKRTETILKQRTEGITEFMQELESKQGI